MGKSVGQSVALDCAQAGMEFPLLDRQVSVSDERPCGERPTTTLRINHCGKRKALVCR